MKPTDPDRVKKYLRITRFLISFLLILAALLKYLGDWKALTFLMPLFCLLLLTDRVLLWNADRDRSAYSLIMAVFIGMICFSIFLH